MKPHKFIFLDSPIPLSGQFPLIARTFPEMVAVKVEGMSRNHEGKKMKYPSKDITEILELEYWL